MHQKSVFFKQKKFVPQKRIKNGLTKLIEKRRPTILGITKLMKEIRSFVKPIEINKTHSNYLRRRKLVEGEYGKRTAKDLANRRKIIVPVLKKQNMAQELWGCHQQSILLCSALRKMGIKADTYRYKQTKNTPHTIVIFELNNKKYEADIFNYNLSTLNPELLKIAKKIPPKPISYEEYKKEKLNE
jgi:hypothetical protein